jgi:hypothetical protein
LRRAIEEAYEAAYERTIRHDTLAGLEDVVRWLDKCQSRTVFTTVVQAAREIGWPVDGNASYVANDHRLRKSLTRRLNMLIEMGWVRDWSGVTGPDGSAVGIVIFLRRDSSVGRALRSVAPVPRQLSLLEAADVVPLADALASGVAFEQQVPEPAGLELAA